jgi:hypothetical protein
MVILYCNLALPSSTTRHSKRRKFDDSVANIQNKIDSATTDPAPSSTTADPTPISTTTDLTPSNKLHVNDSEHGDGDGNDKDSETAAVTAKANLDSKNQFTPVDHKIALLRNDILQMRAEVDRQHHQNQSWMRVITVVIALQAVKLLMDAIK